MKKLFLMLAGAVAITFSSCIGKDSTADDNKTIEDGMNTSETTLGTGSTRPSDIPDYDHETTIQPAIEDINERNPGAIERNVHGQTIHPGGIPGAADTTRRMNTTSQTGTTQKQTTQPAQTQKTDPGNQPR